MAEIGWSSSKDETLLPYAQKHFDVFITIDRKLQDQQNIKTFKLGFVLARVPSNQIGSYLPIFGELLKAAETVRPGELLCVVSPERRG